MKRVLLSLALAAGLAVFAAPAGAATATTYHGTFTTAQHHCGDATYGDTYDVLGTWNMNVGSQGTVVTFNYRNPTTGVHANWSRLNDWTTQTASPVYDLTTSLYGFYGFEVVLDPATGSFAYTITLPDCSYTGWDRLVAGGQADRG